MTRDEGNRAHRHPDAVAYLEGLTEDEARVHPPLVRAHDGGFTRYWIEGGEVRSRDVAGDGLEHDIAGAVPAEFGPLLPRLAADLASGAPDLDAVERGAPGRVPRRRRGGAEAASSSGWTGRCRRRSAGPAAGRWPGTGRAGGRPGSRGSAASRWSARISAAARAAGDASRRAGRWAWRGTPSRRGRRASSPGPFRSWASRRRAGPSRTSPDWTPRRVPRGAGPWRWAKAALRFEREEVLDGRPPEPRMYLSVDGTGIPMRGEEVAGVAGRQADGTSKTREAKLAVVYTAGGRDPETGAALKDRGSESFTCLIDSAAARSGGREPSDFARRLDREARRRGLHDAGELVVVSDGAEWIRNACEEIFGCRKVTFVLDMFHALEYAADAVRAIHPAGAERERRFAEVRADIMAGRAARVARELEPFSARYGEVAACVRYFRGNLERMRYDEYRARGIQVGSGVVEAGCRTFGPPAEAPRHPLVNRGAPTPCSRSRAA